MARPTTLPAPWLAYILAAAASIKQPGSVEAGYRAVTARIGVAKRTLQKWASGKFPVPEPCRILLEIDSQKLHVPNPIAEEK